MSATDTTFTTRDGRLWTAVFTDQTDAAALEEIGVRLRDLAERRPVRVTERFKRDFAFLGGLLWLSVFEQATARGLGPDEFARLFTPAHVPGAAVAILRAIAARYPHGRLAAHLLLMDRCGG